MLSERNIAYDENGNKTGYTVRNYTYDNEGNRTETWTEYDAEGNIVASSEAQLLSSMEETVTEEAAVAPAAEAPAAEEQPAA